MLGIYFLALRFLMPGYFSPLAPFHLDFYDYTGMAGVPWAGVFRYPRVVTFALFKILGNWGVPPLMGAGIGVALAGVVLVLLFTERVWPVSRRCSLMAAGLYLALLFTHPQFYVEHRHDMPAMFSLLFLMLALHAWLSWLKHSSVMALAASLLCVLAFGFTKESFFLSAIVLTVPLFALYPSRRLQTAGFLAFCIAVEIISIVYSNSQSSPFVDTAAAAASPYHIDVHVTSVTRIAFIYLQELLQRPALALIPVVLALTIRFRVDALVAGSLLLAGLAALGPISLLPNHVFPEYAWLAAPFVFAPVARLAVPVGRSKMQIAGLLLVAFIFVRYESRSRKVFRGEMQWFLEQEAIGRNLWASLERVDASTRKANQILITGLDTPFPPWASGGFTRWRFDGRRYWCLVYPKDLSAKNSRNVRFSMPSQADLTHADKMLMFDASGRLKDLLSADQIRRRFRSPIDLVTELTSQTLRRPDEIDTAPELVQAGDRLMQWSLANEAIPYYERAVSITHAEDADVLFRLGRAEGRAGKFTQAAEHINAAIAKAKPASVNDYRKGLDELAVDARSQQKTAPELEIRPPAAVSADHLGMAVVTLRWIAPAGTAVQVHVGRCDGPLLASSDGSGTAQTGRWVRDNTTFYLQDVTAGKALAPENTIAQATAHVVNR